MSWIIVREDGSYMEADPKMRFEGDVREADYSQVALFESKEDAEESAKTWMDMIDNSQPLRIIEVYSPPTKLAFIYEDALSWLEK